VNIVYERHRRGVGYAEKGFELITDMLVVTLKAIEGCPCGDGCPGCIQSPKCGSHNKPLDKHAAVMILYELLDKPPYVPPEVKSRKSPVEVPAKAGKAAGTGATLDRVRRQLRRDAMRKKGPLPEKGLIEDKGTGRNDRVNEIRKSYPRAYMKWNEDEDIRLKELFYEGMEPALPKLGRYVRTAFKWQDARRIQKYQFEE
jgi:hypothetical protein